MPAAGRSSREKREALLSEPSDACVSPAAGAFELFIPGVLPGMNEMVAAAKGSGGTGRAYARLKREWTEKIAWHAKAARLPRIARPVSLQFVWTEPRRRRDPDNIVAGKKLVMDGLVTAGVLEGDGWAHVLSFFDAWTVGTKPGVKVVIR